MRKQFTPVTHHSPDDDELVALRIIELWGTSEFPGVDKAPLYTEDAGMRLRGGQTADTWLANGYVCIGIGAGMFDEHGKGDGISAASCAAEHFGCEDDAGLRPILAYSLRADDKGQDHPFALASLIKTLHGGGVPLERVREMHRRWFDALYLRFSGRLIFTDTPRSTFRQMAIAWLLAKYGRNDRRELVFGTFADAMEQLEIPPDDADALREIARYVDRDYLSCGYEDFALAGIVRAMQMTGVPDEEIMADVHTVLTAKVVAQRAFMTAQGFFRSHGRYIEGPIRAAVITSDSDEMHKAARAADPHLAVLVQRRPSGHTQIHSNQRLDLRPILVRLRYAEQEALGLRRKLSVAALRSAGTHPAIRAWYGFEKCGAIIGIFNGTLKTRRTPRTRLTLDEIVSLVKEALPHIKRRARGVARDRRPMSSATQA